MGVGERESSGEREGGVEGPNENGEKGEEREDVNECVQGEGRVEIIQTRKNNQTRQNTNTIQH